MKITVGPVGQESDHTARLAEIWITLLEVLDRPNWPHSFGIWIDYVNNNALIPWHPETEVGVKRFLAREDNTVVIELNDELLRNAPSGTTLREMKRRFGC